MPEAITFTDLAKRYGTLTVLSDIGFEVYNGEFFGLVGVNGAGKTTLIKCLLDFCAIDAGNISISGVDHRKIIAREHLTFLPERFNPPYYLTGRDFLRYMAELHGHDNDEDQIADILNILDFDITALSKPVRQYSKGMGQKLGLSACLLSEKDTFIFDEPMSGLDPKARANLKQYLLRLKEKGKTLFFSTHLLADVEFLCDRLAVLHDGVIRFLGTPTECKQQYNTQDLEQAYLRCISSNTRH